MFAILAFKDFLHLLYGPRTAPVIANSFSIFDHPPQRVCRLLCRRRLSCRPWRRPPFVFVGPLFGCQGSPRLNHRLGLSGAGVVVVRLQAKPCLENCVSAPWNFWILCGLPPTVGSERFLQKHCHFGLRHPLPFSKFSQVHHSLTPSCKNCPYNRLVLTS